MIILMDLASIWSNAVYTQSVFQTTYPESISPFWFDIIGSSFILGLIFNFIHSTTPKSQLGDMAENSFQVQVDKKRQKDIIY